MIGIGGAPTRATTLPEDAAGRKQHPVASGVLDYFPDALVAVAAVSWQGNEQHNPGQPLHWARGKSTDEADTMIRHFLQRGSRDTDGQRHSAKMVWRALALLQKEIEAEQAKEELPSIAVLEGRDVMKESPLEELKRVAVTVKRERASDPYPEREELSCSPSDCANYSCATRGGFCRKPRAVPMEENKS